MIKFIEWVQMKYIPHSNKMFWLEKLNYAQNV